MTYAILHADGKISGEALNDLSMVQVLANIFAWQATPPLMMSDRLAVISCVILCHLALKVRITQTAPRIY